MALIAEFRTPRETFAAGRALEGTDELTIELERVVPTGKAVVPYFWVWGENLERYEANLGAEPGIGVDSIEQVEEGRLYRVDWQNEMSTLITGLFEQEFALLGGTCTYDGWRFEVRFSSNEAAQQFQNYLTERHVPHRLHRVQRLSEGDREIEPELTAEQCEALLVAYQNGYFEEPRVATLSEVGERLGISPSSTSGRLRRGFAGLVEEHLLDGNQNDEASNPG